jgi:hypothetical protein
MYGRTSEELPPSIRGQSSAEIDRLRHNNLGISMVGTVHTQEGFFNRAVETCTYRNAHILVQYVLYIQHHKGQAA